MSFLANFDRDATIQNTAQLAKPKGKTHFHTYNYRCVNQSTHFYWIKYRLQRRTLWVTLSV